MGFSADDRRAMLALKGVGPTVVARLEQLGFRSLADLRGADATDITHRAAALVGSTCWRNSPQARAAVAAVVSLAERRHAEPGAATLPDGAGGAARPAFPGRPSGAARSRGS